MLEAIGQLFEKSYGFDSFPTLMSPLPLCPSSLMTRIHLTQVEPPGLSLTYEWATLRRYPGTYMFLSSFFGVPNIGSNLNLLNGGKMPNHQMLSALDGI